MQYLFLWSGNPRGYRKARIPAITHRGICGHWRDGNLFVPDNAAIRAALPYRHRAAFDRALGPWFNKNQDSAPATYTLHDRRGRYLTTLYLQPLNEVTQ